MKHIILLFLILIGISSCTRGYYNVAQNYYDYKEAYELVHGLKDGILIVQIPYDKRKTELLKAIYEKEVDSEKQAILKQEYNEFMQDLLIAQKSLVKGINSNYKYSKYAFVPDTLISEFKQGERDNIFLNDDLSIGKKVDIDTSKTILFLRDHRDYDHLFIHKFDGSFPPAPFPYTSQGSKEDGDKESFENASFHNVKGDVLSATAIINRRLTNFYNYNKPPDK